MKDRPGIVFLLDDEPAMLKALERLLRAEGFDVRPFARARDFLESYRPGEGGCLVLDVSMPEIDGMSLQRQLAQAGISLPVVFLTGRGDIPMSVRAMKAGAVDFLTKPVNDSELLRAVRAALRGANERQATIAEAADLGTRFLRLTPREREVMEGVVAGKLNKQIAADLGTGEQNVKVHRGRVMRKMGVKSVADLVRAAQKLAAARDR